jgi:PAS domain S-box-containing protein
MAESFEERKRNLRKRAEALLATNVHPIDHLSMDEIKVLIHDYQVYQIELELQNEELRDIQKQLETTRDRFARLFNDAPAGYLIIDEHGIIAQTNATFAEMVSDEPRSLSGKALADLVVPGDRSAFHGRFKAFFKDPKGKHLKFRLRGRDKELTVRCTGRMDSDPLPQPNREQRLLFLMVVDISEQVRAEEAMRESEARFRTLLEDVPAVAIQGYAMDGTTQYWNKASETLYGYSAREAVGKNLTDLIIPPDMRDLVRQDMQRMAETGKPIPATEMTLLRKDGSRVPIYTSHAVVHKTDSPPELFCIDIDLTELKHTEQELRRAKQRLEEAQRVGGLGDWDWDPISDTVTWSENLYRFFGLEADRPPPNYPGQLALYHSEDARQLDLAMKRSLDMGEPYELEMRLAKPAAVSHVLVKGLAERDKNGHVTRLYGSVLDVTKRKQAEKTMESQKNFLRKVVDAIPGFVCVKSIDGRFSLANKALSEAYGTTVDKLEGGSESTLSPSSDDVVKFLHDDQKVIRNQEPLIIPEEKITFADGSVHWLTTIKIPLKEEDGSCKSLLAVAMDITSRKQAETENEKLQTQLLQAQKMESVGILAGGVAHDFNNLLQAMNGNIQFLLEGWPEDHPKANRLQSLQQSIDRAAQLVRQLLLFSRKAEIQSRPVDLNREVENAMTLMERTIPRMITIQLHLDRNIWPVVADPVQIEQVMLNLGTNAVHAMPDGGTILIETGNVFLDEEFARMHPGSSPGRYVLLNVTDTGCGMDRETQSHLFDPFFTTKEVGKGSGLGLASVYGIIKSHKGYILCYSEPGQGTSFKIYLPAREAGATELRGQDTRDDPGGVTPQGFGETILVVEDEPEIRELTREALESLGYAVTCVESGEQALATFQRRGKDIDLILLDLNMPGMGGRLCMQALLRQYPAAKILIVSGYTANGHGRNALSSGAKGFLGKPYRMQDLAIKVREVLDDKRKDG